ncbi:MAG: hypothetical protein WKG03_21445 [Telluria sp.]
MNNSYLLVLLLALAACRRAESPPPPAPAAPTVKSHAAGVAAAQVIAPSEAAASRLVLDAEGLRLFNAVSGASRLIPFGTTRLDALRAIGAAQKTPPRSEGTNRDCNARYTTWSNGLTVWFAKDRLVGWSATESVTALGTAAGVKVGSSRKALESAHAANIRGSTLGVEFGAGGLGGLLDSDKTDAAVTALWAGVTCIAR